MEACQDPTRVAVVTGANSGIGFATARDLLARGMTVVLACRDESRMAAAAGALRSLEAGAVEEVVLDLSSLESIRAAAAAIRGRFEAIDLLVNNAGVFTHVRQETVDGFELHWGTNHLGHFALTGELFDRLTAAPAGRVVTITSIGERRGRIHLDDINFEGRYRRFAAYTQSKLANVMFALELDRRAKAAGVGVTSVAAHPGGARTAVNAGAPLWYRPIAWTLGWVAGQSAADGARPGLLAATDPNASGGECYGPGGLMQSRGAPVRVQPSLQAQDLEMGEVVWQLSEEMTGTRFPMCS